ncbi:sigma factor-like helix-turn-helix DNA-binding protein [Acetobacter pasteurianus]
MNRVMDAIDAMPERQGKAIRMYHFDGMKLREIAQELDADFSHLRQFRVIL